MPALARMRWVSADQHRLVVRARLVHQHRGHEVIHDRVEVVLGRGERAEQLLEREDAELPAVAVEVGRPLRDVDVGGDPARGRTAAPDPTRRTSPSTSRRARRPRARGRRAGASGPARTARRCARPRSRGDSPWPRRSTLITRKRSRQRPRVALEEAARHAHAVDQHDGPALPGIVVGEPAAVGELVEAGHGAGLCIIRRPRP